MESLLGTHFWCVLSLPKSAVSIFKSIIKPVKATCFAERCAYLDWLADRGAGKHKCVDPGLGSRTALAIDACHPRRSEAKSGDPIGRCA